MSIRGAASLLLLGALAMPLGAQALMERVKASYDTWQGYLEQGDGAGVRKATEPLLQREAQAVSPADYNEMRALVAGRAPPSRASTGPVRRQTTRIPEAVA